MKKYIIGLIVLFALSCEQKNTKKDIMETPKIIEMVLWKFNNNVTVEEGKQLAKQLNDFVSKQPGFISRKTGVSENKFLDVVLWTDIESAKAASEKAMQTEMTLSIFKKMDEREMIFQHFEIFNVLK